MAHGGLLLCSLIFCFCKSTARNKKSLDQDIEKQLLKDIEDKGGFNGEWYKSQRQPLAKILNKRSKFYPKTPTDRKAIRDRVTYLSELTLSKYLLLLASYDIQPAASRSTESKESSTESSSKPSKKQSKKTPKPSKKQPKPTPKESPVTPKDPLFPTDNPGLWFSPIKMKNLSDYYDKGAKEDGKKEDGMEQLKPTILKAELQVPERNGDYICAKIGGEIFEDRLTMDCFVWMIPANERDIADGLYAAVMEKEGYSVMNQHPATATAVWKNSSDLIDAVKVLVPHSSQLCVGLGKLTQGIKDNAARQMKFTELKFKQQISTKYFNPDSKKGELEKHFIPVTYTFEEDPEDPKNTTVFSATQTFVLYRAFIVGTDVPIADQPKAKAPASDRKKLLDIMRGRAVKKEPV